MIIDTADQLAGTVRDGMIITDRDGTDLTVRYESGTPDWWVTGHPRYGRIPLFGNHLIKHGAPWTVS